MPKHVKKIAIIGGTHGNELTGVYLIDKFISHPELVKRKGFESIVMHTNLKAIEKCTRYIDRDLNRAFSQKDLADLQKKSYEDILAKQINATLGPKGSEDPEVDFIVDLHTTTSNMGLSIILDNENALSWQLAAYLKVKVPNVEIFKWKGDTGEASFVHTIAPNGFAIEVGPIPQGVLCADIFFKTENLIQNLLNFFEELNAGTLIEQTGKIEMYDYITLLDFPRDTEGKIRGMIHPHLQGKDYQKIKYEDPLFLTLDGETVRYEEKEDLHAVFINEAAYYEKEFALCLSQKKQIEIPRMTM